MRDVLEYGSGIFGRVVRVLVDDCGRTFAGFSDDAADGPDIVANLDTLLAGSFAGKFDIVMAVGYRHLDTRLALYHRLKAAGFDFATLVHPAAYVSAGARVGEGAIVMTRAIVDTEATIGELAVLWPGATINHNSEVGSNTFLSPGAIVCGIAHVGSSCFIGAGAVITDRVRVADGSFVKSATRYCGGRLPRWRVAK